MSDGLQPTSDTNIIICYIMLQTQWAQRDSMTCNFPRNLSICSERVELMLATTLGIWTDLCWKHVCWNGTGGRSKGLKGLLELATLSLKLRCPISPTCTKCLGSWTRRAEHGLITLNCHIMVLTDLESTSGGHDVSCFTGRAFVQTRACKPREPSWTLAQCCLAVLVNNLPSSYELSLINYWAFAHIVHCNHIVVEVTAASMANLAGLLKEKGRLVICKG